MNVVPTNAQCKYRAFITYSHQDENWARWLHKALETYRVPARLVGMQTGIGIIPSRLAPIFRDRSDLPSAADLARTVDAALSQSANLIAICSPHSAGSRYVNEEIITFKRLGRADRILCLVVAGEPNASDLIGREAEECFAPALRVQFDPDGVQTQERCAPIAADARPGKDGKANAKLKLIAGMLNVGFDLLKQRENQRHVRRLVAITSLSLIVALVTTALAIDAVIARRTAVAARDAAERRQRQAETLVDFMLGDLNDKLSQVQRLDILEATDNQAMKYFQSLPTNDATDQALGLRAKALEKIGTVRISQGRLPEALESYRAAAALTHELAERAPADLGRRIAYANSFNWLGTAYWYQGDLSRSLPNFRQTIKLLEPQAAQFPENVDLAYGLASARTNAGRIFEARGELAQASELYEQVRQAFQELRTREPGNLHWQSELGYAFDNLGKVALERGQLMQAIAAYRDDQRIKVALAAQQPKNYDAREDLLIADAILGRTLALCGGGAAAIGYAREAVSLAKDLVEFDPAQTFWREDLGYYSELLGGMLRQSGQLDEASRLDGDAVRILGELAATDKTNARWRRELALSQVEATRAQIAQRDDASAQHELDAALGTIRAGGATAAGDLNSIVLAADTDIVAGQIASRGKRAAAAREHWIRARDEVTPVARMGADPNALAVQASALLLLNDLSAARPVLQRLAGMGYRTPDFDALLAEKKVSYMVDAGIARHIASESTLEVHHETE